MIRIPKVETRDDVICVDNLLTVLEKKYGYEPNTIYLMAAIESAKGVLNAYSIATCCSRMIGMALSAADYCEDLKVIRTKESKELDWARGMLLNSARAAGVFVMDTSFTFMDPEAHRKEAQHAKELGFDGKTSFSLDGSGIDVINSVFTPSEEEIEYARKIVALEEEYLESGGASAMIGDVFLDKPIVEQYRKLLRFVDELKD